MYTLLARTLHRQNFRLQRACEYGHETGRKIAREWEDLDIDVVIPIPETRVISRWKLRVFWANRTARAC